MSIDSEPDDFQKSVRFGCGLLFGAGLGVGVGIWKLAHNWPALAAVAFLFAAPSSWLMMRYGDSFVYVLLRLLSSRRRQDGD